MNTAVLYVEGSTGEKSFGNIINILMDNGINAEKIMPEEIAAGKLEKFDVLIVPGGRATGQAEALGKQGCQEIESFVKNGRGYVGICAGAYLAVKGYNAATSNIVLVNIMAEDVENWDRGSGDVQIKIMNSVHPVTQGYTGIKTVHYENGPILLKHMQYIDDFKVQRLAKYVSDMHQNVNAKIGIMPGSSAITASVHGDGRCVLFSFHPELTEGFEKMLIQGVEWTAKFKFE